MIADFYVCGATCDTINLQLCPLPTHTRACAHHPSANVRTQTRLEQTSHDLLPSQSHLHTQSNGSEHILHTKGKAMGWYMRTADMFDYWALTLFMVLSLSRDSCHTLCDIKIRCSESASDFITILRKETPFTRLRMWCVWILPHFLFQATFSFHSATFQRTNIDFLFHYLPALVN